MRLKRVSRRDHLLAVKAQLDGLAVMTGHAPHEYLTPIPAKRGPRQPTGNRLEKHVLDEIREWARYDEHVTLWRNTMGTVELPGGGMLRYGVGPNGAADFIGYRTMIVTQEMVGQRIAVFCAVEAKGPRGEPTDDQIKFIDKIRAAGGKAGIAHDAAEAKAITRA